VAKAKSNRRPAPRPQAASPAASSARRLGTPDQQARTSAGAQRRRNAASKRRSNRTPLAIIGVVVVIAAVFIVIAVSGSSKPPASSSNGVASGQDPVLASLTNMVEPVTTIPLSVYDSVGVFGQPLPQTLTKGQTPLTSGSKPEVVYIGAEYCPYCAMTRWPIVAALSRFGTFKNLKMTSSANDDGNIPTFSFLRSTYTSPYITFSPFEGLDRDQNPLQVEPTWATALYTKYDGNESTNVAAAPFNTTGTGIPFLDFGNKLVSSGAAGALGPTGPVFEALQGGGPASTTAAAAAIIAASMHDPSTAEASAIGAKYLVGLANYFSADICTIDGNNPASVCSSAGVKAALTQIKAAKAVG
jgi:thiol-disulfide isomerase/thioredoxin